ncbi:MAG: hypothetical protein HY908_02160 [Myxococcales bacterium]|nr:hypothetical protein [Myxococcales bacterium]
MATNDDELDPGYVLCELERDGKPGEVLRVSVRRGAAAAELRVWFRGADGELRPSPKGCTIRRHELARVVDALRAAAHELELAAAPEPYRGDWGRGRARPARDGAAERARLEAARAERDMRPPVCPQRPAKWSQSGPRRAVPR